MPTTPDARSPWAPDARTAPLPPVGPPSSPAPSPFAPRTVAPVTPAAHAPASAATLPPRPPVAPSTVPPATPSGAPVGGGWYPGPAGGQPPSWPPAGSGATPPSPNHPSARPPRKGRGAVVAAVAVAALLAGTAGGIAGATLGRDDAGSTGSSASAVDSTPVTTAVGPVDPDAAEPAAAVAAALGPAVVQIETQQGLGSGFVYDASGLILTANHVTDGSDTVTVRMADGTKLEGRVLGEDPSTDVAVVQIDPPDGMAVATLATGVDVQVGQTAIAIGSPFGLEQTVTAGIVSAVGRPSETPGGVIPAIQTDAPINSGNSGGALADRQGRIIGINDSIITGGQGSTGNVGIGFAIPIDIAKAIADKIVAGEPTAAGFLGIQGADATGNRAGAAITSVEPGSPADDAGLSSDDVVVAVDGTEVTSMIDLAAAIRTAQPGDSLDLTVVSGGQERQVTVTLGSAPSN